MICLQIRCFPGGTIYLCVALGALAQTSAARIETAANLFVFGTMQTVCS